MNSSALYDAVVVGSGPNGLAAAITLAKQGHSVVLFEAKATVGGGMRSGELTLPGFQHDICSAIHPLGIGSPFFQAQPLAQYGLEWIQPDVPLAHVLDSGDAVLLQRSIQATAQSIGGEDGEAWQRMMEPMVSDWQTLMKSLLAPLPIPYHPVRMVRLGLQAIWPAQTLARWRFGQARAQALFAGLAAHSLLPLEHALTASFGLMLGLLGHAVGWPLPRGGSQRIADALAAYLQALGGEIVTDAKIEALDQLPAARVVLLDIAPRHFLQLAQQRLPLRYRQQLERFRYGAGVFKIDYALSEAIPWRAADCRRAGTVHLGGTLAEIAASERAMWRGAHSHTPFVLVAQQSLFDPTRAPEGKETAWAYCHVPHASTVDMTQAIENQIERFAPGFRDCILARATRNTQQLQAYNANYIGGDINGGVQDLRQFWTRPVPRLDPYSTPLEGVYLCSSSTPPGGGVHGMCGYHAARSALRYLGNGRRSARVQA